MFVTFVSVAIVTAGIVLLGNGWKKGNWLIVIAGILLVFFSLALFGLNTLADMKKAGVL